ncbi:MAG: hypothetical protein HY907_10845 [Deltaproteobacteria bacterium]|nr:hypothetical protein [Deltaproteobacteria bacterium]
MNPHPHEKNVLRHLRLLGTPIALPTPQDVDEVLPRRGRGAMLFDFYSPEAVEEALDRYGVTPKLHARGFGETAVELETADPEHQVVRVRGRKDGHTYLLGEAFLHTGVWTTTAPFAERLRNREVPLLFIQWLRLQDPTRPFGPDRPRLPGQDHPGLGVGREVVRMFLGMAERLHLGGIASCPEFAHNAVLYETVFRFFDPAVQGRFDALRDACAGLTLAELAWAVETERVVEDSTGTPVRWSRDEMICPTGDALREHLESREYRERMTAAKMACRLHVVPHTPVADEPDKRNHR